MRAELRSLVRALSQRDFEEAARCVGQDPASPWDAARFETALEPFFERYERVRFDPEARQAHHLVLEQVGPKRHRFRQGLLDPAGDNFWSLEGEIDLAAERPADEPWIRIQQIHD